MDNPQPSIWMQLFGHERNETVRSNQSNKPVDSADSAESAESVEIAKSSPSCHYFSLEALDIMRDSCKTNPYPGPKEIERIANLVGHTKTQVKRWFYNNRRKRKPQHLSNRYSPQIKDILEKSFELTNSPDQNEIDRIANMTGLTTTQIAIWFSNTKFFRKRRFNDAQEEIMLEILGKRSFMNRNERLELAERFNTKPKYIHYWLQNRRANRKMISDDDK